MTPDDRPAEDPLPPQPATDRDDRDRRRWDDRRPPWDRDDPPFYERAHRGGMILAFGIISLVMLQMMGVGLIFGILAWIMGGSDLRAMDEGEMDPEGRSLTQAGRICGILGAIFGGLCVAGMVAYFGFIIAVIAAGPGFNPPVAPPPPAAPAVADPGNGD